MRAIGTRTSGWLVKLVSKATLRSNVSSGAEVSRLQTETIPSETGEERFLAILFCDMRNFTPLVGSRPAFDVVHLLNRYFTALGEPILQNNGLIYQYVGDEITGLFGVDGYTPQRSCLAAVRELLRRAIESQGWTATEAVNGREGLDQLAQAKPDLVLLDLMMPEVDGFEFMYQLRRDPSHKSTPVIVITAKDLTKEDRELLNGAVSKILTKAEFDLDDLLREIKDLTRPGSGTGALSS